MTNSIRVGIAGLGRSGWNIHAYSLGQLPEHYKVTAVMDLNSERRAEAEEKFGCQSFDNYDALIGTDTDLIVVASPSHFHMEHTVQALGAGKHVIVEKPMAQNPEEAEAMIAAAQKADRVLTVNQNYRYKPSFRKVSDILKSGKLGEIIQIRISVHQFGRRWDWQTLKKFNGGILTNHGAHVIDWMLQHFNDDEPQIFSYMVDTPLYAGDADSHAKILIKPNDGPLMDVELTHASAYKQDYWTVMGTQGSLTGSQSDIRWKYFDPAAAPPLVLDTEPTPDRSYNREPLPFIEESMSFPPVPHEDMAYLYTDLYGSIRDGKSLEITAESVLRQMRVFERCREAAGWS